MSDDRAAKLGTVGWIDLTVDDAESVRDFYSAVVGWRPESVDMGGYADFNMTTIDGEPRAGVCHARGANEGIPPAWMIYINPRSSRRGLRALRAAALA